MLEDESQNLDHLAVAAWRLKHALLQSSEGGREFGERRAVAECARFALNDRQIVPPIENGRRTLSLVRAGKDSAVFADDLPFGDDDDTLGIDPHADRAIGEGRRHAIAIALQMDQARRRTRLAYSTKPSNDRGNCIKCCASSAQASATVPACEPCSV